MPRSARCGVRRTRRPGPGARRARARGERPEPPLVAPARHAPARVLAEDPGAVTAGRRQPHASAHRHHAQRGGEARRLQACIHDLPLQARPRRSRPWPERGPRHGAGGGRRQRAPREAAAAEGEGAATESRLREGGRGRGQARGARRAAAAAGQRADCGGCCRARRRGPALAGTRRCRAAAAALWPGGPPGPVRPLLQVLALAAARGRQGGQGRWRF
mmetsp:Transcript_26628/g.76767  ORF Transcript_26628/g.76767 Transcript_26628/m.76767 type:complete len:217 (+) Transcript_26628:174-824(+)